MMTASDRFIGPYLRGHPCALCQLEQPPGLACVVHELAHGLFKTVHGKTHAPQTDGSASRTLLLSTGRKSGTARFHGLCSHLKPQVAACQAVGSARRPATFSDSSRPHQSTLQLRLAARAPACSLRDEQSLKHSTHGKWQRATNNKTCTQPLQPGHTTRSLWCCKTATQSTASLMWQCLHGAGRNTSFLHYVSQPLGATPGPPHTKITRAQLACCTPSIQFSSR